MGKEKNRKRAKMLRQRKKEREKEEVSKPINDVPGLSKIKSRLEKEFNADVKFNHNNKPIGRKISDVVSEMIKPLLKEAKTFDEKKKIIGLGVMAWNLGVIKKNNGEKEMQKALSGFGMMLPKDVKNLLLDYSEVKCENYGEYNELIIDYEFTRINPHQNNLTVSYKMINE